MSLLTNLAAYWKLDESSGSALDSVGTNDLTDEGSVGTAAGKVGTARAFTRASFQAFSRPDDADLSTGDIDFTIALWVNLTTQPGTEVFAIKGNDAGGAHEYALYQAGGTFKWTVEGAAASATWGSAASNGTWYHVVAWHDSVNNLIGIAVNAGTPVTTSYSGGVTDGTDPFTLGRDGTGRYLDGLLDEVGSWKRVLTSAERTSLYNGGAGLAFSSFGGGGGGPTTNPAALLMCM